MESSTARLDPRLQQSLDSLGITRLYRHQAKAINAARRGENVIVSTPSASGKSLCYQIPVLDAMLEDKTGRALYLFPTKALTQDQYGSLSELLPSGASIRYGIFDGDTPEQDRSGIRRNSRVVLDQSGHAASWHTAESPWVVPDAAGGPSTS